MADPDSIRVSGTTGETLARICDLTVNLVPNPKYAIALQEEYSSDSENDDDDEEEEPPSLTAARNALDDIERAINAASERYTAAERHLFFSDQVRNIDPLRWRDLTASHSMLTLHPRPKMKGLLSRLTV